MLKGKIKYIFGTIFLSLFMLIALIIFIFGYKKTLANDSAITVNNFEELEQALSKANQDTEIVVSQTINLSGNMNLDGHGATIRVENPYVNSDGKVGDNTVYL